MFKLVSKFQPAGDQPKAIEELVDGVNGPSKEQVLLGATGTGKTYTISQVISKIDKPVLVLAHNKTLAGQLYSEFKQFFPEDRVEFFISYYDYYQPEAYVASRDLYIEKDAKINDEIDQMRHSATASLMGGKNVIVISSVSCIYNIGSAEEYGKKTITIRQGDIIERDDLLKKLIAIQYDRNDYDFKRGTFRVRGDSIEIIPPSQKQNSYRIEMFGDEIERIREIDVVSGKVIRNLEVTTIFPASHFVNDEEKLEKAIENIENELVDRVKEFKENNQLLEAQRIEQRTKYDIEMLRETGFCSGVENYSRQLALGQPGKTPDTLIDFFKKDFILVIDESHITIPQVRGMYKGDRARKQSLVDHGFRLPSALDNRPLNFEEFWQKTDEIIYVSATPGDYEIERSNNRIIEQVIRPTGLLDPIVDVRPTEGQIDDIISRINDNIEKGDRTLITTLTIRMSEELTKYLKELGIKVAYLHSEIKSLERINIIRKLRRGDFDVVVGINLLREGLDIPEVSLICILDADKEGFLRNKRSLIQTIGRAARNENGRVVLYADKMTDSMRKAIEETARRREIQEEYNLKHGITPSTIKKSISEEITIYSEDESNNKSKKSKKMTKTAKNKLLADLERQMKDAAKALDFEKAMELRDVIFELKAE